MANMLRSSASRSAIARFSFLSVAALYCCAGLPAKSSVADVGEIVVRAAKTIASDWAADPDYAYVERNEVRKGEQVTSQTFQVVMVEGSDYRLPIAVNDQPLPAEQNKAELEKFRNEVWRRSRESPAEHSQRVQKYRKQNDENGELLLEFPKSFAFDFAGEELRNQHPAYLLNAKPLQRTGELSRAVKVLGGMHGKLWLDKENLHVVRAECEVFRPVPIYGALAKVMPGTHIVIEMTPMTPSVWLISEVSMELHLSKLIVIKGRQVTRTTYTGYRLNGLALQELMAKAAAL